MPKPRWTAAAWIAIGIAAHLAVQFAPALHRVTSGGAGRDYASYHYAVQVALDGGDPYDTAALSARARAERTRKSVHPFFYPPPFVGLMAWSGPLSLPQGALAMLWLNEVLLAGVLAACMRWWAAPAWGVAVVLGTYSPIPDHAWMGQANLLALLPAVAGLGLARTRPWLGGALVGAAAMIKMSPAVLLLYPALRLQWRVVLGAVASATALSLLVLPLVGPAEQLRFYTEILPGFSSGDYHGLKVPISLPANHSIPDLFDRVFPTSADTLSTRARQASLAASAALLAAWAWRFGRRGDDREERLAALALLVPMVVIPVYGYEHHLVFVLPAILAAAGTQPGLALLVVYFFLAWPLAWLRDAQGWAPSWMEPAFRESKFVAALALYALMVRRRRG